MINFNLDSSLLTLAEFNSPFIIIQNSSKVNSSSPNYIFTKKYLNSSPGTFSTKSLTNSIKVLINMALDPGSFSTSNNRKSPEFESLFFFRNLIN
jgi:hypothetical protein